ncbi:uncharacterized protein LOC116776249 [Danaus plexippus]|uniref:uncharacterized protein LOC116776249 n=1 Tax=Danaus plexippus TaxID=13037 RepID=UPI002AB25A7F|nr:uncharacterized protein LOC116776249 [Danaus plexippus]
MIGKILLFVIVSASAGAVEPKQSLSAFDYHDVDPNTLSCDPLGEIFLLLPHYVHCNKFFMCAHGNEVEFDCPATTIFDFPLQTCNHAWAANCTLRTRDDDEGSGEGAFNFLDNFSDVNYEGSVNSLTADEVISKVRPLAVESPVKPSFNGLNCQRSDSAARQVAYKGDCQRYWRCVNGVLQTAYCSDGLFFNERSGQCDFEANVKCADVNDELENEFIVYKK